MNISNFKKSASFGLDIGNSTVKVVQIKNKNTKKIVSGYGFNEFKSGALIDGEVMDFDVLHSCIETLLKDKVIGTIDADNVVLSIPATNVFIRVIAMPKMSKKDLEQTVIIEAEQYIPTSITELYIDHEVIAESPDQLEVLVVAAPKKIIDSYVKLFSKLGIKISSIESSMDSTVRVLRNSNVNPSATLVIDLGSIRSNLAVLDNSVRVTGYTSSGGVQITKHIEEELGVDTKKAEELKIKEGLSEGPNRSKIEKAIEPVLNNLSQEVRRMIAYYNKRHPSKDDIDNVVLVGGSSKMPGLDSYIEKKLKIPTILCDPWVFLEFEDIEPPEKKSNGIYTTSVGLALANYEKAYRIKTELDIDEDIIEEDIETQEDVDKEESSNEPPKKTATSKDKQQSDPLINKGSAVAGNKQAESGDKLESLASVKGEFDKAAEEKPEKADLEEPKNEGPIKTSTIIPPETEDNSSIKTGKSRFK